MVAEGEAVGTMDVSLTPDEEEFLSELLRLIGEGGAGEGEQGDQTTTFDMAGDVTGGGGKAFDLGVDKEEVEKGGGTSDLVGESVTTRGGGARVSVTPDIFSRRTTGFRGLGTTGLQESLTAFRPAGEIRAGTGKPRKNVWNEASLRLKDALGL